jgi:hypothetical protein
MQDKCSSWTMKILIATSESGGHLKHNAAMVHQSQYQYLLTKKAIDPTAHQSLMENLQKGTKKGESVPSTLLSRLIHMQTSNGVFVMLSVINMAVDFPPRR